MISATKTSFLVGMFIALCLLPMKTAFAEEVLNPVCESFTTLPDSDPNKPALCKAQSTTEKPDDNSIYGQNGILTKATRILLIVVGVASVIMMVIGGIKYVLSSGDAGRVNDAKNTILYAVIGLVVSLVAQGILSFVIRRL